MIWNIWSTTLIVDQVHEDVVVVEWDNEALSVIEKQWFPVHVQEGDFVELRLEKVPLSNCRLWAVEDRSPNSKWLSCDGLNPVYLPISPTWRGRMSVYWDLQIQTE